jgi:hypothetical protein
MSEGEKKEKKKKRKRGRREGGEYRSISSRLSLEA